MELKLKIVPIPDAGEATLEVVEGQANLQIARCFERQSGQVVAIVTYLQLNERELERAKMGGSPLIAHPGGRGVA